MNDKKSSRLPGINKIETVADILAKKPLELHAGLCLRARSREDRCGRCLEVCAAGAISFDDESSQPLEVDFARCNGCGACVTVCPTGAFEYVGALTDFDLLKKTALSIRASDQQEICFTCRKVSDAMQERSIGTVCLARLHESLLVGAAKFGAKKVFLVSADCRDCAYDQHDFISRNLGAAIDLSKNLRFKTEFLAVSERDLASLSGDAVLIEKEQPTRRELIENMGGILKVRAASWAEQKLGRFLPKGGVVERAGFVYQVPRKREMLLELMSDLKSRFRTLTIPELPFADLVFDDEKCDFCEQCALFCPTTALAVEDYSDGTHLVFYPAYCVKCGLCERVCRRQALSLTETVKVSDLISRRGRALISAEARHTCSLCSAEFVAAKPQTVCPTCLALQEFHNSS